MCASYIAVKKSNMSMYKLYDAIGKLCKPYSGSVQTIHDKLKM